MSDRTELGAGQEIDAYCKEIAQVRRERDQAKRMLQNLLHSIQANRREVLSDKLGKLVRRAMALVGAMGSGERAGGTVVPFIARFEDVSAAELEAEARHDNAAEGSDSVNTGASGTVANEASPAGPAIEPVADSPVAEIIDRIALLTRALMQTSTPREAREAAESADEAQRIA